MIDNYLSGTYQRGGGECISVCQVTQSRPSLCDPWTSVHGMLQARIPEWVAIPFSTVYP